MGKRSGKVGEDEWVIVCEIEDSCVCLVVNGLHSGEPRRRNRRRDSGRRWVREEKVEMREMKEGQFGNLLENGF